MIRATIYKLVEGLPSQDLGNYFLAVLPRIGEELIIRGTGLCLVIEQITHIPIPASEETYPMSSSSGATTMADKEAKHFARSRKSNLPPIQN
jgi:hypothetical protein